MAYVTPNYVKLNKMPDPKKEYNLAFPTLDGGLNLMELDYRIATDESPEMKNLLWREGILSCRDGQSYVKHDGEYYEGDEGSFHAAYSRIWNGHMFVHEGDTICSVDPNTSEREVLYSADGMSAHGSFFPYSEKLYYKTEGFYVEISFDEETGVFSAKDVEGYSPITYINCAPENGSGTVYQPENRISPKKTLWYNSKYRLTSVLSNLELSVAIEDAYFRQNISKEGTYVFTYKTPEKLEATGTASRTLIANIDSTKFCNKVGKEGTFEFFCTVTNAVASWTLGGESVKLFDYGVSVNGIVETGDKVTVIVSFVEEEGKSWTLNRFGVDLLDYGITLGGNPQDGDTLSVTYSFVKDYYLPIKDASISRIEVDGEEQITEDLKAYVVNTSTEQPTDKMTVTIDRDVWRSKMNKTGRYKFEYDILGITWKLNGVSVRLKDYGLQMEGMLGYFSIIVEFKVGDYYLDIENGIVHFVNGPKVSYPEVNNTVRITYNKENAAAYNNIMDCTIADVYGGTGSLCIVMAGSKTQPNAYFWNGQNSTAVDASYFPMTQYQLAGDIVDPITGFGKQQGYLIIFNKGSVGRTTLDTAVVDERTTIDLPYVPINAKIGCDYPHTIQLVENNLVWCNSDQGVHFLANTSAAYENNIICLSTKVNTSRHAHNLGLLTMLRRAKVVCSMDDELRYWLTVDDTTWVWDYQVSTYKNPSWFYFTKVPAMAYIHEEADTWHFDSRSRLTKFIRNYTDYDGEIEKVYRFATQYFNTYDTYKNINSVIINTRSDTNSVIDLQYLTDYEERYDLTPLSATSWILCPRNLAFRQLKGSGFAFVFRRRPMCRRVRYFTMRLSNNTKGMDMSIVSAQVYYNYQGKQR